MCRWDGRVVFCLGGRPLLVLMVAQDDTCDNPRLTLCIAACLHLFAFTARLARPSMSTTRRLDGRPPNDPKSLDPPILAERPPFTRFTLTKNLPNTPSRALLLSRSRRLTREGTNEYYYSMYLQVYNSASINLGWNKEK